VKNAKKITVTEKRTRAGKTRITKENPAVRGYTGEYAGKRYNMLKLKNKAEREEFVRKYHSWENFCGKPHGLVKQYPGLGLILHRYKFANGAELIVLEYAEWERVWNGGDFKLKFALKQKYHLIIPGDDTYAGGCSMGTVADYMTKNKDVI
jgi:hypothetical protein